MLKSNQGEIRMWIDRAAENSYGLQNLFEEYLDRECFNNIRIIETKAIRGGERVYVVKATQYVKDIEKTFYFGDFSVCVDLMENPSYARKSNDILFDAGWFLILHSNLKKEDRAKYKAEAREYHIKKLEDDMEILKSFWGKRKVSMPQNTADETLEK